MDNQSLIKIYPHDLNLYNVPPSGTIMLPELESISIDRVKVLKLVHEVYEKNKKRSAAYCKTVLTLKLKKLGLIDFAIIINGSGCNSHSERRLHARRKDHLSHFMLRSAFSFSSKKKKWFYLQELRLFKWRCTSLDKEGIKQFMAVNGLHYTSISTEEKQALRESLQIAQSVNVNDAIFYKVPFTNAINLINARKVFIKQGMAYVPEANVISLFIDHFKKILTVGFKCARAVLADNDDYRTSHIFRVICKTINVDTERMRNCKRISVHDIDKVSKKSFPLCMRRLHEGLKTTHHLTNGGRLQYGLFLKGIGISLDEAITFWKEEFLKRFDERIFNKEYKYGILHQYGAVGRQANYQPFNCEKILNCQIGFRDFHGCPYKHLSVEILRQKLLQYGLPAVDSDRIIALCNNGDYQSACTQYFEVTHGSFEHGTFRHPNDYYDASQRKLTDEIDSGEE